MAAKTADSDGGSMTPSEPSDGDDRSDRDSDYESDDEEEHSEKLNIQWTGYARRTPVILFCPEAILAKKSPQKDSGREVPYDIQVWKFRMQDSQKHLQLSWIS